MKQIAQKNKKLRRLFFALPCALALFFLSAIYLTQNIISVDGIIFLIAGIYILVDSIFMFSKKDINYKPSNLTIYLAILITTLWIMLSPHYSSQNAVAVSIIGVLLIPIIISGRSISKKSIRSTFSLWLISKPKLHKTLIIWEIVLITFLIWEAITGLLGLGSFQAWYSNPTLTNVIKPLFNYPICYLVSILLWLLVGVYILRRGKP